MSLSRRSVLSRGAGTIAALALPAVARAQAAPIRLVFSHHLPISHIGHKAAESFVARVKDGTAGQVTIDIRPASQLFNLRTSAEALQLGTLDMCWSDLGTLANWQPQFGFVSLPFLFNDFEHVKRVMYGPIGKQVSGDRQGDTRRRDPVARCLGLSGLPRQEADPEGRRRARYQAARAGDPDLGRDGTRDGRQPDADPRRRDVHRPADRRHRCDRGAGRLHRHRQDLRSRRLRHQDAPHLHRGLDDGEREEDGDRCRPTCRR